MPFQGNRIIVIVIIIALAIIIGAALASQSAHTPVGKASGDSISVSVQNNIGVKEIEIQNMNTGKTYIFTLLSLPNSFNCTEGDYLQVRVSTHEGYRWNGWWFSPMDTWNNDNPAIICASGDIVSHGAIIMRPNCILIQQPSPTSAVPSGGE
jgi:hypothetical protein